MAKIRETDFFKQTNILLTKKHKEKLEELKRITTLSNNVEVDNSTFIRAMIEYLHDKPETCKNIRKYIVQNKGATYVTKFEVEKEIGKSNREIADVLGVDEDVIDKINSRIETL